MKPLTFTIIEFQSFGIDEITKAWIEPRDEGCEGTKERAKKFFHTLEDFAKGKNNGSFLKYHGKHKLKAQNYEGIIETKYGTLEILPKCFRENTLLSKTPTDEEKTKVKESKKRNKEKLKKFFTLESFKS